MDITKKEIKNSYLDKLLKFNRMLASLELRLSSFMVVIACCISLYTIIVRNSGYSTADWAVDFPIALVSWAIFVGVGANFVSKSHINTDFFTKKFPQRFQKAILIFVNLILINTFVFIIYYSVIAEQLFFKTGDKLYEMFDTPIYIVFSILPISVAIWCFHLFIDILNIYFSSEKRGA